MIVHRDIKQGSLEWLCLRAGIPTASEIGNLVTPKFEIRKGQMPASYLAAKVAEKWQGGPLPAFGSWSMEQGSFLEAEAIPWYELEFNVAVERVGFVTTDGGLIGCSPDGLLPDGGGIEIKCPEATNHVKYLLEGEVPEEYLPQIHCAMFVTGADHWKFLSYRRHFPALVLEVERDEEIQGKLAEALALFLAKLKSAMDRMAEINGGPSPAARPPTSFAETKKAKKEFVLSELPS